MKDSDTVVISEDRVKLRPKENPDKWPLTSQSILSFSNLKVDVPEFVPGQAFAVPNVYENADKPYHPSHETGTAKLNFFI